MAILYRPNMAPLYPVQKRLEGEAILFDSASHLNGLFFQVLKVGFVQPSGNRRNILDDEELLTVPHLGANDTVPGQAVKEILI